MKAAARASWTVAIVLCVLWAVAYARQLGAREARAAIATALGITDANSVRVKNISPGLGGQATVDATVETAFRFVQDKEGNWKPVDVRLGDGKWESLELINTALRKEKVLRTTADLQAIATALEAFNREHGFYVAADSAGALVDNLAPQYLRSVLRLDAWSREFEYKGTTTEYKLFSLGPDGKARTDDDIVVESGRTKGAGQ